VDVQDNDNILRTSVFSHCVAAVNVVSRRYPTRSTSLPPLILSFIVDYTSIADGCEAAAEYNRLFTHTVDGPESTESYCRLHKPLSSYAMRQTSQIRTASCEYCNKRFNDDIKLRQHRQNTPFCKKRWDKHLADLARAHVAAQAEQLRALLSTSVVNGPFGEELPSTGEADFAQSPPGDPGVAMDVDNVGELDDDVLKTTEDVDWDNGSVDHEYHDVESDKTDTEDEESDEDNGEEENDEGDDPEYSICPSMDPEEDSQVTEVMEHVGRIIDRKASRFQHLRSKQLEIGQGNVYYPFAGPQEWETAKWLHGSHMPLCEIDRFLHLQYVCVMSFRKA
jgi:hypothetical protein